MTFLFWFSIGIIFYTYGAYPIMLTVATFFFRRKVEKGPAEPSVNVILSAFNEERLIERKILNLLELDYPTDKLEILVGSDGASDRTDEIVSKFQSPRVRFFRFVRNLGKPHVLRELVEEATGDILVFTDTRQEIDPQAVRALVANFEDPQVGCVSGELYFKEGVQKKGSVGEGMDFYWRYEKFLRKKEGEIGSMLGATGALYAVRKSLFPELPPDILVDDMYIPLAIVEKGFRAVFEPRALTYDRPSEQGGEEFARKVRTLAGNYQIFAHFPDLFIPFKSPIAWQLFSHKFLRLLIPFFLAVLFVSNLFVLSSNPFYLSCFAGQLLFYGLAAREAWKAGQGMKGVGTLPYTFCLLNYSAFVGFLKFVTKRQKVAWERAYA